MFYLIKDRVDRHGRGRMVSSGKFPSPYEGFLFQSGRQLFLVRVVKVESNSEELRSLPSRHLPPRT